MTDVTLDERDGSAGAGLAELYERHAGDAVRLAYLLTGDREVARDLARITRSPALDASSSTTR